MTIKGGTDYYGVLTDVRTSFDLNPEQEWTQVQKARKINL